MLGLHRLGGAIRIGRVEDLVVEDVATFDHRHVVSGMTNDDDVLERRQAAHRRIDRLLHGRGLALAPRAVDGDQHLRP